MKKRSLNTPPHTEVGLQTSWGKFTFRRLLVSLVFCCLSLSLFAQNLTVEGTVVDTQGAPLVGATIIDAQSNSGATTNAQGEFSLKTSAGHVLTISFIGYKEVKVNVVPSQMKYNVTLEDEQAAIDDVVVVGYGTQKKVNLTGSVASVPQKTFERPIVSVSSALQGVAPGVTVTTQSGAPGDDGGSVRVRGISTFGGSSSAPLVLIDGVEGSLSNLDANQIASVSVLKDAASSAIYGSRAANGVILVTTKRGSAEKFVITYRGTVGWQKAIDIPDLVDGATMMRVYNEAAKNDGSDEAYRNDEILAQEEATKANPNNYDWQKAILKGSGLATSHFVSMSASSANIRNITSLSYTDQKGIIKRTGYERYTVRNNMDVKFNDKLSMKFDASFTNRDRKQVANEGTVWGYLSRMPTNIPIRYGDLWSNGWVSNNPVAFIEDGGNVKTNNISLLGSLSMDYTPVEWLTLTGVLAPKYQTTNTHNFTTSIMTYNEGGDEAGAANTYTSLKETANRYFYGNYQFYATFNRTWSEHTLKAMLGASRESYDAKTLMAYRRDYAYDDYEVIGAGADDETKDNGGARYQWLLVSAFGRVNYDYKGKYLLEANVRYDGSSRFASGNQWKAFPSFSAGWRISEEPFMHNVADVVSQLKLRASWGQLGNQNIGSDYYPFASMLATGSIMMNDKIYPLVTQNSMANRNLIWEQTEMADVGVDVTLFNRLTITADWYRKMTKGILMQLSTTDMTGLAAPYQNAGKVRNIGWEISIGYNNKWGDFEFGVNANLSDVHNKIVDMKGQTSGDLLRQQEGSSINSIYGYVADGLFQSQEEIDSYGVKQFGTLQPGDIKYKDIAGAFDENGNPIGDGQITDADKQIIGSTIPRYTFGLNLDFAWKGLRLNAFFQGVGKADGYLNSYDVIPCQMAGAVRTWQMDYWTKDNPGAEFPRLSTTSANNTQNSTFWMRSAAYLRLKNLQIGYQLPKKWVTKIGLKDVFVYVNGQNLFTAHNFYEGYDPEAAYDSSAEDGVSLGKASYYPQVTTYTIGLDIKF